MIRVTSLIRTSAGKDQNKLYFEKREYEDPSLFLKESFLQKRDLKATEIPKKFWQSDFKTTQAFATEIIKRAGVLIDSTPMDRGKKKKGTHISFVELDKSDVAVLSTDARQNVRDLANVALKKD